MPFSAAIFGEEHLVTTLRMALEHTRAHMNELAFVSRNSIWIALLT